MRFLYDENNESWSMFSIVEFLFANRNVQILGGCVFSAGVRGFSITGWAKRYDRKNFYTNDSRH